MHTFDYFITADNSVDLSVSDFELKEEAQAYFEERVKDEGLSAAVETCCGVWWEEAEANLAVGCIDYVLNHLMTNEKVIVRAQTKIINEYLGV